MCCKPAFFVALILATTMAIRARAEAPSNGAVAKPLRRAQRLPTRVDLRPMLEKWRLNLRSQGKRNTCSVFVTTGALEFAVSEHFQRGTPLSVEYLNWACNQVINNQTKDRGQFFNDLLKGFERYGICYDSFMPYQDRFEPELKPSDRASQYSPIHSEITMLSNCRGILAIWHDLDPSSVDDFCEWRPRLSMLCRDRPPCH